MERDGRTDKRKGQIYLQGQVENEKLKKWCDGRRKAEEDGCDLFPLILFEWVILV